MFCFRFLFLISVLCLVLGFAILFSSRFHFDWIVSGSILLPVVPGDPELRRECCSVPTPASCRTRSSAHFSRISSARRYPTRWCRVGTPYCQGAARIRRHRRRRCSPALSRCLVDNRTVEDAVRRSPDVGDAVDSWSGAAR